MNLVANVLLALGAAPIISCDAREFEELIKISSAININIGTLDDSFITRSRLAIKLAAKYGKCVSFDPVGSGASAIRTTISKELSQSADIVRGNASEIMSLATNNIKTLGVESLHNTADAEIMASSIARDHNCTIVVSGQKDFVVHKDKTTTMEFGSSIMSKITGMGCALTAVLAAFRTVINDPFLSASIATAFFTMCGEQVQHSLTLNDAGNAAPGSFLPAFIDTVYNRDIKRFESIYHDKFANRIRNN